MSVPERAMLELLSNVGKNQSLDEAGRLVETLRSLRTKVLEELMAGGKSWTRSDSGLPASSAAVSFAVTKEYVLVGITSPE